MSDAIKVEFLQPIFDEDFPAGDGMIASRNDAEMLRTLFKTYLRKID